jgi:hypothetical protein
MLNAVIASGAKHSMAPHKGRMDCFVANAPRNDECPHLHDLDVSTRISLNYLIQRAFSPIIPHRGKQIQLR